MRLYIVYRHDCLQNAVLWTGADRRDKHTEMRNKQRLVFTRIKERRQETKEGGRSNRDNRGEKDGTAAIILINEKARKDGIKEV